MSALVVGSFAPDFSYLLSLSRHVAYSHTISGMFMLDFPLAFVALWLFHEYMKEPMLVFLPGQFRQRLRTGVTDFSFWPTKRLALIMLSILVGIATHLAWDALTHNTSWVYQHWSFLRRFIELPTGEMRMDKALEYGSSVFGLAVIAAWIWYWYRTTEPSFKAPPQPLKDLPRLRIFVLALPELAILGGALRAYHVRGLHKAIRPMVHLTTDTLISVITFFLFGLLAAGVMIQLLRRRPD